MKKNFQDVQKEFSAHIRNPEKYKGPSEVEARRLKIYSELFYNNVEGFIAKAFPVLKKIYGDTPWHQLIREFFENHHSQSPYFSDIAKEFLNFLENERQNPNDPPFLRELAQYEWVELALEISQEELPTKGFNSQGNLLKSQALVSPLAWLLQYQWPVHKIGPDFQPLESTQTYFLIVYRNSDYQIHFLEVSPISARLLSIIQENPHFTGTNAIEVLSDELISQGIIDFPLELLLEKGEEALIQLRDKNIILGTRLQSID